MHIDLLFESIVLLEKAYHFVLKFLYNMSELNEFFASYFQGFCNRI